MPDSYICAIFHIRIILTGFFSNLWSEYVRYVDKELRITKKKIIQFTLFLTWKVWWQKYISFRLGSRLQVAMFHKCNICKLNETKYVTFFFLLFICKYKIIKILILFLFHLQWIYEYLINEYSYQINIFFRF